MGYLNVLLILECIIYPVYVVLILEYGSSLTNGVLKNNEPTFISMTYHAIAFTSLQSESLPVVIYLVCIFGKRKHCFLFGK